MMKLWVLGTDKGRPTAILARKQPPVWKFNGYYHIGKKDDWDESMVLDDDQAAALHTRLIPPGRYAVYHISRRGLTPKKSTKR